MQNSRTKFLIALVAIFSAVVGFGLGIYMDRSISSQNQYSKPSITSTTSSSSELKTFDLESKAHKLKLSGKVKDGSAEEAVSQESTTCAKSDVEAKIPSYYDTETDSIEIVYSDQIEISIIVNVCNDFDYQSINEGLTVLTKETVMAASGQKFELLFYRNTYDYVGGTASYSGDYPGFSHKMTILLNVRRVSEDASERQEAVDALKEIIQGISFK